MITVIVVNMFDGTQAYFPVVKAHTLINVHINNKDNNDMEL